MLVSKSGDLLVERVVDAQAVKLTAGGLTLRESHRLFDGVSLPT
jgi:hypothetical protein